MVENKYIEELEKIDKNLYIKYNDIAERYEVRHKIPFTNIDKHVIFFVHEDGSFRNVDYETIDSLKNSFDWNVIYEHKTGDGIAEYYLNKMKQDKEYTALKKRKDTEDMINEDIKKWKLIQDEYKSKVEKSTVRRYLLQKEKEDLERSKRPFYY